MGEQTELDGCVVRVKGKARDGYLTIVERQALLDALGHHDCLSGEGAGRLLSQKQQERGRAERAKSAWQDAENRAERAGALLRDALAALSADADADAGECRRLAPRGEADPCKLPASHSGAHQSRRGLGGHLCSWFDADAEPSRAEGDDVVDVMAHKRALEVEAAKTDEWKARVRELEGLIRELVRDGVHSEYRQDREPMGYCENCGEPWPCPTYRARRDVRDRDRSTHA